MAKLRRRHRKKSAEISDMGPQLYWTPLPRYRDGYRWKQVVVEHGGHPIGMLWTARKWPLSIERPVRIGFAEWEHGRPSFGSPYFFGIWNERDRQLVAVLKRAMRSMLFMYISWWLLAVVIALDLMRGNNWRLLVVLTTSVGVTVECVQTVRVTRKITRYGSTSWRQPP
jgi:hypothetical protein